jgi:replicative DNA helicase
VKPDELRLRALKMIEGLSTSTAPVTGRIGDFAGKKKRPNGITTGFEIIDKTTITRGLPRGQMSTVLAGTGDGKTWILVQFARQIAELGYRVCFATFADLDREEIADRATFSLSGRVYEPPEGSQEHEDWCNAIAELKDLPVEIYDASDLDTGYDVETFGAWVERHHAQTPFDVVLVDYAQELSTRNRQARSEYDAQRICAQFLRRLAKKIGVALVVASQISIMASTGEEETKGGRFWGEKVALLLLVRRFRENRDKGKKKDDIPEQYRGINGLSRFTLRKNRFGNDDIVRYCQFTPRCEFRELT